MLFALALSLDAHAAIALAISAGTDEIYVYDTTLGTSYSAGYIGFDYEFGDFAYDDIAYKLHIVVARPTPELWTWDLLTGSYGPVGPLPPEIFAADVDPQTGHILAADWLNLTLWDIDPATAAATPIASLPTVFDGGFWDNSIDALVFNTPGSADFYSITRTGVATHIGGDYTWINNNDFDLEVATGVVHSMDYSSQYLTFSHPSYTTIGPGSISWYGDAFAIIDNPATPGIRLTGTGSCPGPINISITGLTPGGRVAILQASGAGSFTVPSGSCAGTVIPLNRPRLLATPSADASGAINATPTFGAAMCGKSYLAVDLTTCALSNVYIP